LSPPVLGSPDDYGRGGKDDLIRAAEAVLTAVCG